MKAVREAAVDWCLEKDLHEVVVFGKNLHEVFRWDSQRCVEKWPHLGSLTIFGVHIMQMLQM